MYAGIWEIDLHGKNEYQARVTLDAALRPSPDYDVSRWLYVPNTYSEYRYILARPCGSWCAGNTADTRRCCVWRRQAPA